jgi:hypothetical protein
VTCQRPSGRSTFPSIDATTPLPASGRRRGAITSGVQRATHDPVQATFPDRSIVVS